MHHGDVVTLIGEHPGGGEGTADGMVRRFTDLNEFTLSETPFKVLANVPKVGRAGPTTKTRTNAKRKAKTKNKKRGHF
ncbi:MAG: hypothetical protein ACLQVG_09620 [Terriglobia bacterium]